MILQLPCLILLPSASLRAATLVALLSASCAHMSDDHYYR
jgi:hypothetical protein